MTMTSGPTNTQRRGSRSSRDQGLDLRSTIGEVRQRAPRRLGQWAAAVLFVAGLSLAIASLNAVFRDVEFVVTAALLPWFFLTPILYQLDELPGAETHPWLVDLIHWANPMTPAVEAFRAPLFLGVAPTTGDALYLAVETIVALALGAGVFIAVDDRIASEA